MNLILLYDRDFESKDHVCLSGRRLQHMQQVHRVNIGDRLNVGHINGLIGQGLVTDLGRDRCELRIQLDQPPPPPLTVTLLLALPRPKMLKRVLQSITSMGVKQVYLINSYRVEKSFWGSPLLQPDKIQEQLVLGLEQACDTLMPQVHYKKRFKPFVEDELPGIIEGTQAFVAHPAAEEGISLGRQGPVTLAIGPEGGFIPYEVQKLREIGFTPISLGPRILRVETAVPVLLGRFAEDVQ